MQPISFYKTLLFKKFVSNIKIRIMSNQIESNLNQASEFNRFGLISMILLVIGCVGGIAVGLGAINYVSTLIMVVVPTMTTLSLLLAVAPMRWIINSAIASLIIDIILIVYFLIV
jgi:hypothetical protein